MATPDYSVDRSPMAVQLVTAFTVLTSLSVLIRFWFRVISRTNLWWDDWLALIDLAFWYGQVGVTLYWVKVGLGKHVKDVYPPENVTTGLKLFYVEFILFHLGITTAKLSVLCFYARIFKANKRFSTVLWVTGGLVIAWLLVFMPSSIWQCTPIEKVWHISIPGHCIDTYKWWLGSAISSVIIDAIILITPLPMIWTLKLKFKYKMLVAVVFICGYSVIAITFGRLAMVYQNIDGLYTDITYAIVPMGMWILAETPMSIISMCLPNVFSFVKQGIREGPSSLFKLRGSQRSLLEQRLKAMDGNKPLSQGIYSARLPRGSEDNYALSPRSSSPTSREQTRSLDGRLPQLGD